MIEQCYTQIGSAIRALRRSRGLSQQQLADLFEVPVTALLFGASEEMAGKSEGVEDALWREWSGSQPECLYLASSAARQGLCIEKHGVGWGR